MRTQAGSSVSISSLKTFESFGATRVLIKRTDMYGRVHLDDLSSPRVRRFYANQAKRPVVDALQRAWTHPVTRWFTFRDGV